MPIQNQPSLGKSRMTGVVTFACFPLVGFSLCCLSVTEAWAQKSVQDKYGNTITKSPDGTTTTKHLNGSTTIKSPDGTTTTKSLDGLSITLYPNGRVWSKQSDDSYGKGGTRETWITPGSSGETIIKDPHGQTREYHVERQKKNGDMVSGFTTYSNANGQLVKEEFHSYDAVGLHIARSVIIHYKDGEEVDREVHEDTDTEKDTGQDASKEAAKDAGKDAARDAAKAGGRPPEGGSGSRSVSSGHCASGH